jgi:hypothetical protein
MSLKLFLLIQFIGFYHSQDFEIKLQNIRGNVKGTNMLFLLDRINENGVLVFNMVDKGVARHSGRTHLWMVPLRMFKKPKTAKCFFPRP